MKVLNKLFSILLCLILLIGLCAPAALAARESTVIRIYTVSDFIAFSRQCTLDSWSRDKTVLLERNIDLSLSQFQPIPTFGGTFDGQGNTITGLNLRTNGEAQGLFRYVQQSGIIKNLTVDGILIPSDHKTALGGIAGINYGTIAHCIFRGTLRGEHSIGGITGINGTSGQILNCSFTGTITGEHYVGGIAGQNLGSIVQCRNSGAINTTEVKATLDPENLDLEHLNSTANMPAATDIGGIAGFSSGTIQSCHNTGDVGYPHVGYNIGGIVGRHNGYLDSCTNKGHIQGRKDVGGIAGQMEPQLMLKYDQTALDLLWGELDALESLIDGFLENTSGAAGHLTGKVQSVSDSAVGVKDAVADLSSSMTQWADGSIARINDASARVSWVLERMVPVADSAELAIDQIGQAFDLLSAGLDEASLASKYGAQAADAMALAMEDLQHSVTAAHISLTALRSAMDDLTKGLGSSKSEQPLEEMLAAVASLTAAFGGVSAGLDDLCGAMNQAHELLQFDPDRIALKEALEQLRLVFGSIFNALTNITLHLENVSDAAGIIFSSSGILMGNISVDDLKEMWSSLKGSISALSSAAYDLALSVGHLNVAFAALSDTANALSDGLDHFSDAGSAMAEAFSTLEQAAAETGSVLEELAAMPAIQFDQLSGSVGDEGEALNRAADGFFTSFNDLNSALRGQADLLTDDLQAISAQLGVIVDLLHQFQQEQVNKDTENLLEDVSDRAADDSISSGKISNCENLGCIEGDLNVAGITGSIAIEYDFDPEDDLTVSGSRSIDMAFLTRGVVHGCINRGEITSKKNAAGGIVGLMDLGYAAACQSYGPVTSTSGNYVGGIAGQSFGGIADCWVKCALSGGSYVGGIAGSGSLIQNCRTLIDAPSGAPFTGAVAGQMEENGILTGNLFVHHALAGVDGISYDGGAQPVPYKQFITLDGMPDEFAEFSLTFTAGGKTVAVIPFQYGDGLDQLPEIPEKAAHSSRWAEHDYSFLFFSRTIEAQYTPYDTALSDGLAHPSYLVDGSFSPEAVVSVTQSEVSWTDGRGDTRQIPVYTVTVTDPQAEQISYTLHWRLPEDGDHDLWILNGSEWVKETYTPDGSYLLLACSGEQLTFCLTPQAKLPLLLFGLILLAVIIIAVITISLIRRANRKKKQLVSLITGE